MTNDKVDVSGSDSVSVWIHALVLCCAAAFYYFIAWSDQLLSLGGDSARYLFMARHYLHPHADALASYFTSRSQYPPLFPGLLALFGGGRNLLCAHLFTVTVLVLGFAVLILWQRNLGIQGGCALLVAAVFALSPGTYFEAVYIHSEGLFLLLVLLILVLHQRAAFRDEGGLTWFVPLLVACLSLTRAAGVAMIAAYAITTLRKPSRRAMMRALLAGLPFVVWTLLHAYGSDYVHTFASMTDGVSTGNALQSIDTNLAAAAVQWHLYFFRSNPDLPVLHQVALLISVVGGLIALGGFALRLVRLQLDALFVLCYLVIILVWPFPAEMSRFLLPIVPIALVYCIWFYRWIAGKLSRNLDDRAAGLVAAVLCLIVVGPSLAQNVARYLVPVPSALAEYKRSPRWYVNNPAEALANIASDEVFFRTTAGMGRLVDDTECIYSIKPPVVSFLSGRLSIRPEIRNGGVTGTCGYALLLAYGSPSFPPMYPLAVFRANGRALTAVAVNKVGGEASDRIVSILATWK